jgi:hypothetical protein
MCKRVEGSESSELGSTLVAGSDYGEAAVFAETRQQ